MSRVLLGVGASVAVYKACDLASQLAQSGFTVRACLTRRAAELISPQLFEAVTGERAYTSEFGPAREGAMDHIELARWAQALVVAPATADLLGRLALGLGDDLLTTVALAVPVGAPRLVSPAMNPNMLANPAVKRNLATLVADGWTLVEPASGHMACGDDGAGRLPEPAELVARVRELVGG